MAQKVVRTAQNLEKKYNFASMLGLKKNVEKSASEILKIENELNNILNALVINLKDVLDSQGEISLWFYSGIPTTENAPYVDWVDPNGHLGDIYYDQDTGVVYQWNKVWEVNTSPDLVEAMAITNADTDTSIDHERKVFFETPYIPYSNGDWFIKEDGSLFICQISKTEGIYEEADFIDSSRYTESVSEKLGDSIKVLKGTVTTMTDSFAKFTDLATGGSTVINGDNILTGTIDAAKVKIANNNVVIDAEGIKLNNGAKVVGNNGLMNTYLFDNASSRKFVGVMAGGYTTSMTPAKESTTIEIAIPEGLELTKAKMHIYHNPVFWAVYDGGANPREFLGWSRSVKLYKASNLGTRKVIAAYGSEYSDDDSTSYTDAGITWYNTNGSSLGKTFTPATPTTSSYAMTEAITSDFSNLFKSNGSTVPGIYQFKLETSESVNSTWEETECAVRTGMIYAILELEGYMSYK